MPSAPPSQTATLTIRNLDPRLKQRLRVRAARHGHSMEAEARLILQTALREGPGPDAHNLYERIHARFARFGGVDLEPLMRDEAREPPLFD